MPIPIPVPGVKDVIDGISTAIDWFDKRKNKAYVKAWRNAATNDLYRMIIEYYVDIGKSLFSYPYQKNDRIKVPLYVEDGWDSLSSSKIKMSFKNIKRQFHPNTSQEWFWDFFKVLKQLPSLDLDVFRLTNIQTQDNTLQIDFELGKFSHSVMSQYILEHELITLLSKGSKPSRKDFKLRNKVASDAKMIKNFFLYNVGRIGVCNLMLLRRDKDTYIPMVQRRGALSMTLEKQLDPISSCIFEVATSPKADFELKHTVLREIYEELFGGPEVVERSKHLDPYFFYKKDGINDLLELLENGSAIFEITGFCIDLIRIVPEITTVLVVTDEKYFKRHYSPGSSDPSIASFKLNPEFDPTSLYSIPSHLDDIDGYLKTRFLSDPDEVPSKEGFDPLKWTLPGGFSFYLGMKRAVQNKLL